MSVHSELDAAGITDPAIRASYALCRRINARHGRTFYLATLLLPPPRRPFVHALYGFARHVDDIVDELAAVPEDRAERFRAWSQDFLADLDWGATSDPVSRAVLDTIARWAIPVGYFVDFLDSMRMDLTIDRFATFDDLAEYVWGSAAVIGLQVLPILGRADGSTRWDVLETHAAALGTAFQLTNFLRDIAEDLRRGRVYLPQTSLDEFGVDRDRLRRGVVDEPIRNLLAFEIERARGFYRRADPGIEMVDPASRDCLRTARTLYSEILDEIEDRDYDVFSRRVTVGLGRRARVAAGGARSALMARRGTPDGWHAVPTTPTGSA